jgi:uncharacterized membrane protein
MLIVMYMTGNRVRHIGAQRKFVIGSGVLDTVANALYLLAVRHGLMSIVATINSFYPASTLLLATRLDKEKIHRSQAVGLGLAALALVLITVA